MPRWFTRNDNWDFGGAADPAEDQPVSRSRASAGSPRLSCSRPSSSRARRSPQSRATSSRATIRRRPVERRNEATDSTTTIAGGTAAALLSQSSVGSSGGRRLLRRRTPARGSSAGGRPPRLLPASPPPTPRLRRTRRPRAFGVDRRHRASTAAVRPAADAVVHGARRGNGGKAAAPRARSDSSFASVLLPKTQAGPEARDRGPGRRGHDLAELTAARSHSASAPPLAEVRGEPEGGGEGRGRRLGVMLGILRARGAAGHIPADRVTLQPLAARLGSLGPAKGDWATDRRVLGRHALRRQGGRARALRPRSRAGRARQGSRGREGGDRDADPGGSEHLDLRRRPERHRRRTRSMSACWRMIAYLRESFGQVTVSCLISGHRLYARPGVISAHIPGHAVDISGLGGIVDPGSPGAGRHHRARRS